MGEALPSLLGPLLSKSSWSEYWSKTGIGEIFTNLW